MNKLMVENHFNKSVMLPIRFYWNYMSDIKNLKFSCCLTDNMQERQSNPFAENDGWRDCLTSGKPNRKARSFIETMVVSSGGDES
jgi:hypothetical protein